MFQSFMGERDICARGLALIFFVIISEGLLVVLQSLQTNRAACLCTISNLFRRTELPSMTGSQTNEAYSTMGLT